MEVKIFTNFDGTVMSFEISEAQFCYRKFEIIVVFWKVCVVINWLPWQLLTVGRLKSRFCIKSVRISRADLVQDRLISTFLSKSNNKEQEKAAWTLLSLLNCRLIHSVLPPFRCSCMDTKANLILMISMVPIWLAWFKKIRIWPNEEVRKFSRRT